MPPTTSAHDAGAAAYDRFTGRWSRLFVPCLVAAAGVASGRSVLDVAAGTGEAAVGLAACVGPTGLPGRVAVWVESDWRVGRRPSMRSCASSA